MLKTWAPKHICMWIWGLQWYETCISLSGLTSWICSSSEGGMYQVIPQTDLCTVFMQTTIERPSSCCIWHQNLRECVLHQVEEYQKWTLLVSLWTKHVAWVAKHHRYKKGLSWFTNRQNTTRLSKESLVKLRKLLPSRQEPGFHFSMLLLVPLIGLCILASLHEIGLHSPYFSPIRVQRPSKIEWSNVWENVKEVKGSWAGGDGPDHNSTWHVLQS